MADHKPAIPSAVSAMAGVFSPDEASHSLPHAANTAQPRMGFPYGLDYFDIGFSGCHGQLEFDISHSLL